MVCVYTFPNGDVVRGKPALKAYLTENLAQLLPERAIAAGIRQAMTPAMSRTAGKGGQQIADTFRFASTILERSNNPPTLEVVETIDDPRVPQEVRDEAARQKEGGAKGSPEGFYLNGTVYLINGALKSPKDVARVLFHESLGHYGLRGLYGQALNPILSEIVQRRKNDVIAKATSYGLDVANDQDMLSAAEEVLAEMAQTRPNIGFVQRAIAAIRTWLRANVPGFGELELSDAEIIRDYILPARAFVENGAQAGRDIAPNQVRFSRAPVNLVEDTGLTPPEQGMLRRVQAAVQDNMNRVKQVQERIEKLTGSKMPEVANYYGAEANRPGRIAARLEDVRDKMTKPLIERLVAGGYKMPQLSELLHAQHAKERNEAIAAINPEMEDGGSGMTNAQADAILAKYRDERELLNIAEQARKIARATLDLKLAYGLIDEDTYQTLTERYENYVPLKGDGEYGPKIKRAMGHDERDEFIIENIARDYDQAVVVGEKNLARQSLLAMALENPDPELWTVGVAPKGRYVAGQIYSVQRNGKQEASFTSMAQVSAFLEAKGAAASQYEVMDSGGDRVQSFTKPLQENEVPVYLNGQMVRIQIVGDETLAAQLRPMNQGQMNVVLRGMGNMMRYLSRIYTGYNPAFILTNAVRDASTGTINILGNEGLATTARAWANYPSALKTMAQWAATKKVPDNEAGKYLAEYRAEGGKVGASWMADLEQQTKSLQRMYDDAYGASGYLAEGRTGKAAMVAGRKVVGGMAHVVEIANQATENALRLALFMAMRKQGVKASEAARAAKTVTVDFDRKGTMTGTLGAIYLFFNPAVQGAANALRTLASGKYKKQAWAALGMLGLLGFYAATSGMDDDKDRWLGENWTTRSKTVVINIAGQRITIPLSLEFAPFYAFGVAMGEVMRGESKVAAAGHMLSSFLNAYFPLGGVFDYDSDNKGMDALQAAVPTVIKPGYELAVNRSSFGSQISPENEFTKDKPDNLKMYRGTKNTTYDKAAQAIAAGGEKLGAGRYENDLSKVSPETLKYLWRTYTGGLGAFVTDSIGVAGMAAEGDQIEAKDVPIVNKFVREQDVRPLRSRFYNLADEAKAAATEFKQAKKAADDEEMDKILADPKKSQMISLERMIKQTKEAAAAIRDEEVEVNADKSLSPAQKRAKLKELEQAEEELYRGAIEAFR